MFVGERTHFVMLLVIKPILWCPLEDIYFMWTFYSLFLLLTAVGMFPTVVRMFPTRWEHSHRGENILTAVRTFSPWWKHSHRGEKYSHRGENIPTAVRTFPPRWEGFPPRWKHPHRGENILTAVRTFPPQWEVFPPRWEATWSVTTPSRATISCRHATPFIPLLKQHGTPSSTLD